MCFSYDIQTVLWFVSDSTFNTMHLKTKQMFFFFFSLFSVKKEEQSLGQEITGVTVNLTV